MYHPSQVKSEVRAGDIPPMESDSEAGISGQGAFPVGAFVYQGDQGARMLSHNKVKVGRHFNRKMLLFFPFPTFSLFFHFHITIVSKTNKHRLWRHEFSHPSTLFSLSNQFGMSPVLIFSSNIFFSFTQLSTFFLQQINSGGRQGDGGS